MIGSTVAHYMILEKLGEGGMGVVYKAQDTKLNRIVALKFLPDHVSADEHDTARFLQEAQSAASLNHPNICTIHGIEDHEGKSFIVMEFVEGRTLRELRHTVSQNQALEIAIQIAEGLAAAHEKGIVHRDIKPENIMIRKDGRAQIMDFGLAKLRGVSRLTKEGTTVGTAYYMSPEQVQGMEVDHRSDIFSLGTLMFELFAGQLPFKGMHETAVSYEIVHVDSPPMSSIRADIPPPLDSIVLDCLEKDPKERTQAASQVALELKRYRRESSRQRTSRIVASTRMVPSHPSKGVLQDGSQASIEAGASPRWKVVALSLLSAVILLVSGFALSRFLGPKLTVGQPLWVTIDEPGGLRVDGSYGGHTVISPDGRNLAFVGRDSTGHTSLYLRALASTSVTKIQGTDDAIYPFWSPDGASLAFFAGGKLKRVDISGSPPLTLADAPNGRGGAWSSTGVVVYSPEVENKNLYVVRSSGGSARQLTDFDTTWNSVPRFPFFLPGGDHFLFVTLSVNGPASPERSDFKAYVGDLDGAVHELPLTGASNMFYSSGHLVYVRQTTLIAQSFDPGSFEITGDPIALETNVNVWPQRAKADFSVSQDGLLVIGHPFRENQGEFGWVDKDGRQEVITGGNIDISAMISPDATKFAYDQDVDGNTDIWVYDMRRNVNTRFTFHQEHDHAPVWSPDGKYLYFSSTRSGTYKVYRKPSNGAGEAELMNPDSLLNCYPQSFTPDGKYLLMTSFPSPTESMICYLQTSGGKNEGVLVHSGHRDLIGRFSPDGRWFIYQSNESGRFEIYLRPFLREGGKMQVSSGGGENPLWSRSGEIFFVSGSDLIVVRADLSGSVPQLSPQERLFGVGSQSETTVLDVTRDGKRFLARKAPKLDGRNDLLLIVNWPELVRKD